MYFRINHLACSNVCTGLKKRKIGRIQRKLRFLNPSNALFEGLLDKPGEPAGSLRGTPIDECFDLVARRMSAAPQILR